MENGMKNIGKIVKIIIFPLICAKKRADPVQMGRQAASTERNKRRPHWWAKRAACARLFFQFPTPLDETFRPLSLSTPSTSACSDNED